MIQTKIFYKENKRNLEQHLLNAKHLLQVVYIHLKEFKPKIMDYSLQFNSNISQTPI